ncbi:MAG: N-acetylmuramoyl-L-alanine amidase, partial [Bacilli bacterium]
MRHIIVWFNRKGGLRLLTTFILMGLLLAIFTYDDPDNGSWSTWSLPLAGKVIILDAGHGGPDGGAVGQRGMIEKNISLPITTYLRDYLQEGGAVVHLTREGDHDLAAPDTVGIRKRKVEDLRNRVKFVNESHADFLVSIHLNS